MKFSSLKTGAVLSFLVLTFSGSAFAQSVQSDFDNDGHSELTLVTIKDNKSLEWNSKSYMSGQEGSHGNLGKAGDHIIMGKWDGLSIGVIKEDTETGKVTWKIKNQNGETQNLEFGTNKDLFVSGADIDGDGRTDAIVVEKKGKKLKWKIMPHPFGDQGAGAVIEKKFGKAVDPAFFMDLDGTGDWIGTLAKKSDKGKKRKAKLRNLVTGETRTVNVGKSSVRPQPIQGEDGRDLFAFVIKKKDKTTVHIRNQAGTKVASTVIATSDDDDGEAVIGDFTSDPGEEIAIHSGSEYLIFNPAMQSITSLGNLSGIPVDEININGFSSSFDNGEDGDKIEPDNCGALNLPDGTDGNLWKPNSDTQYYAVFVAHSQYTGKIAQVRVYKASNGDFIKNLTYKGVGNGNRSNWQDYSLTGSDYKNKYGAIRVRIDLKSGSCVSAVVTDPSDRVD